VQGSGVGNALCNRDFYAWANEQARLLRADDLSAADIEHIVEEIESMGRSEKRELISCLTTSGPTRRARNSERGRRFTSK
jgi:hypothetical protein